MNLYHESTKCPSFWFQITVWLRFTTDFFSKKDWNSVGVLDTGGRGRITRVFENKENTALLLHLYLWAYISCAKKKLTCYIQRIMVSKSRKLTGLIKWSYNIYLIKEKISWFWGKNKGLRNQTVISNLLYSCWNIGLSKTGNTGVSGIVLLSFNSTFMTITIN